MSFQFAAFYSFALSFLILSGNLTPELIAIFCRKEAYTLGNFGQVWANWHSVGCFFVGMMNLSVVRFPSGFGAKGKQQVACNTAFIFGVWGIQNAYYCLFRQDLFLPLMWLNAVGCLGTAAASLMCSSNLAVQDKRE